MRVAPLLALLACGPSGPSSFGPKTPDPGTGGTTGPAGTVPGPTTPGPTTPGTVPLVAPEVVYGVPNLDGGFGWMREDPDDDDVVWFDVLPSDPPADRLAIQLDASDNVRIWHDGAIVLDATADEVELPGDAIATLGVEFRDFDTDVDLFVDELDAAGEIVGEATTRLRSSPLFLNHHLSATELVVSVQVGGPWGNASMIATLTDELGAMFEAVPGNPYGADVWIQDEVELAWGTTPEGGRIDFVIDSIRDRGLDDWPEDRFTAEGSTSFQFDDERATSLDSFGNLEISPPIDGWPQGRVYYGDSPAYGPNDAVLYPYLEDMAVQDPFTVDSTWLCVGHVDEWMSWVPDATAPRGFRFVYTDTNVAWDVLEAMDPDTALPRWAGFSNHGYDTVGEILADDGLRALNDELQAERLDPLLDQMKTELGLLDEEVVLVAGLFEEPQGCGRTVAALIPGMANLLVVNTPGQATKVFTADPFVRSDLEDQGSDPVIADFVARMPAGVEVVFLDDWETYHLALGEVHCGTNSVRTPDYEWWLDDVGGAP